VRRDQVNNAQVVELITSGRSGSMGVQGAPGDTDTMAAIANEELA
jgi:hypothetical protein